jgi:hypothetical protein
MNITVIIPAKIRTLQEAEWLKVAIASVPAGVPVVLVNDHSLIDWKDVRKVCKFSKQITVKTLTDKTGLAAARNCAMESVQTEFFFPLDADDYLMPDALTIAMDNYPGDGFLYGSTVLFDDRQRSVYKAREYDVCKLFDSVYWPNGCLQKTENWAKIKWDETLTTYEDWDYWIRSFQAGIYGHAIPDVLYAYRKNPNGIIETLKRNKDMTAIARDIIQTRHEKLFAGDDPMCSGCGNKKKVVSRNTKTIAPSKSSVEATIQKLQGMVMLEFLGYGPDTSYYGESGIQYRFGQKHRFGNVAEADVAAMLKRRKDGQPQPLFRIVP